MDKDHIYKCEIKDIDAESLEELEIEPHEVLLILNEKMTEIEICEAISSLNVPPYDKTGFSLSQYIILK